MLSILWENLQKESVESLFLNDASQFSSLPRLQGQRDAYISRSPFFQKEEEELFTRAPSLNTSSSTTHRRAANRTHAIMFSLSDNCSICEIFRISAHCLTCLQGFCSECDRLYHSYPDRANHRRTTVTSKASAASQRKSSSKWGSRRRCLRGGGKREKKENQFIFARCLTGQ